jgi:hypothetical protein
MSFEYIDVEEANGTFSDNGTFLVPVTDGREDSD